MTEERGHGKASLDTGSLREPTIRHGPQDQLFWLLDSVLDNQWELLLVPH